MLQPTSRIEQTEKGISFYEQDILFDDYIYTGDFDIEVTVDYNNIGFGIMFANSEGSSLLDKDELLLFKIGNKNAEVIYKKEELQSTIANFSCAYAKTCTEDLSIKIQKRSNKYILFVGSQKITEYKAACDIESFNIGYYSNKDNVIKKIKISASVPYSWMVNMENTNGGYIEFFRDGFELKECTDNAEIGQMDILLRRGKYYLKYKSTDTDVKAYVFESEADEIIDDEKNILKKDGSFTVESNKKVTIKFVGTKGKISKICITSLKDNEYVRTNPDVGNSIINEGSYIKFLLDNIKEISFKGTVFYVPGNNHTGPFDYQIIADENRNYGIYDTNTALNIQYEYKFAKGIMSIYKEKRLIKELKINGSVLTIFKNINAVITDLIVTDINGNNENIIVENTIKKFVPGAIKSPITVLDETNMPLDLSSSYRYYYKNGRKQFVFTNKEREYFKPAHSIRLNSIPSSKSGTIITYGIRENSKLDIDRILEIEKEGKDTIDACANIYDILFESDLKYVDKKAKEIRISDLSDYKLIIVDYLKEDSFCINYRYNLNSYEVDISTERDDKNLQILYDNTEKEVDDIEYINEKLYLDTQMIPSASCYIVLGR